MKQESDLLLIQRIRKNDPKAWSELDRRYRGRLRAFVRRRLNQQDAIEDIVQEIFLGFHTSLPNFDEQRDLETWLFTIANYKVTDYLRRHGRRPKLFLPCNEEDGDSYGEQLLDQKQRLPSSIARSAERRELEADVLAKALQSYVSELRQRGDYLRLKAIELIYVKGWRNQDVAAFLHVSEQDIANWRFQSKSRLQDRLIAARLPAEVFPELQQEG
ncbi:MAG: RNA polymerase sigma factor [Thermogemmata sp.]|jgi:RNA polymerase sigma-70 factor (ECF subfamily)|uniref:RNA polymerase sigma factor n=1 Tax=Thermogemmata fonticola TaxID=2755323 RepID=A0A7V8VBM2_9BACT|nr:RNA polymerase sigma factor [Thermogemmata fonticola]MBA2225058.1 RNA polymerase sigma factor [Thermogemmata fonticola]MCX8139517.1 RNA polymerase sigma factor [Gemmataceae bacterium]GIW84489.1 MAG: DNA-directed RNA polymerase sigma-70 factor [Gemmataceae bacterium]